MFSRSCHSLLLNHIKKFLLTWRHWKWMIGNFQSRQENNNKETRNIKPAQINCHLTLRCVNKSMQLCWCICQALCYVFVITIEMYAVLTILIFVLSNLPLPTCVLSFCCKMQNKRNHLRTLTQTLILPCLFSKLKLPYCLL